MINSTRVTGIVGYYYLIITILCRITRLLLCFTLRRFTQRRSSPPRSALFHPAPPHALCSAVLHLSIPLRTTPHHSSALRSSSLSSTPLRSPPPLSALLHPAPLSSTPLRFAPPRSTLHHSSALCSVPSCTIVITICELLKFSRSHMTVTNETP